MQLEFIGEGGLPDTIQWRVHIQSTPQKVFDTLASDEGRRLFWAQEAPEQDGFIHFKFINGMKLKSKVLEKIPPVRFTIEYFGGSRARFDLAEDGRGGTDVTLTESEIPLSNRIIHLPGWIPVLLCLKAAVDFSIDLRNHDPKRSWERGYVDG